MLLTGYKPGEYNVVYTAANATSAFAATNCTFFLSSQF